MKREAWSKKRNLPVVFLTLALTLSCNGGNGGKDAADDADAREEMDVPGDEAAVDLPTDNLMEFDWLDGQCEGVWIDLERRPTNLIYLADRSTSMLLPADGHEPTEEELGSCAAENYAPASGITYTTKWDELGEALSANAAAYENRINLGLLLLPGPGTIGTGMINIELFCEGPVSNPRLMVDPAPGSAGLIQSVMEDGENNPICNIGLTPIRTALETASNALVMAGAGPRVAVVITDGGPSCNLSSGRCAEDSCTDEIGYCDGTIGTVACLDDMRTIDAIGNLLEDDGMKTYVVGIPGSEVFAEALDGMAVAGGTAAEGTPKYRAVTTTEELIAALAEIAEAEIRCMFELDSAPPDETDINVLVDDRPLARDDADGYAYNPDDRTIELTGQACQDLLDGTITSVQFLSGCPPF
jgi:hypothetical protein